jgi:hypothetical protein
MKTTTFLELILLAIVSLTGCTKDNSTTDTRDVFVATYSITETWTENSKPLTKPAFTMTVEKATQHTDMLLLNNFANYGAGITVEGTVNESELTIVKQTLPNSKTISGSGTFTATSLTITYTENQGSTSIIVTATANKL